MKKSVKISAVIIALVLTLVFAVACGGGNDDGGGTAPTEHSHTAVTDEKVDATCTESGLTEGSHCAECGKVIVEQETIPAKGHTPVDVPQEAPTCTDGGKTEGQKCADCGIVLSGCEYIPPVEHIQSDVYSSDEEYHWHYCLICGEPLAEKEPHAFYGGQCICGVSRECSHENTVYVQTTIPSCTEDGVTITLCQDCGETLKTEIIEKFPHIEHIIQGFNATCTADGKTDKVICLSCNITLQEHEVITAKGHTPAEDYSKDVESHWKNCTVCSMQATDKEDHVFDGGYCLCGYKSDCKHESKDWVVIKDSTCAEYGQKEEKCNACGATLDYESIPKKEHTEETVAAVEPTCTQIGFTEGLKCGECGITLKEQEEVPATGHEYGAPVFIWSGYTATAKFTCVKNGAHVETKTASVTSQVTTEPTCSSTGIRTHTASITSGGTTYKDTKEETLGTSAHTYGEPVFVWSGYTATAELTCVNNASHKTTKTVTVTQSVKEESTCTKNGTKTHTASITLDGNVYTDSKDETLALAPHSLDSNYKCYFCDYKEVILNGGFGGNGTYTRVDENGNESEDGTYILFGTYPQTLVTGDLATELTNAAGILPTESTPSGWISYKYYKGSGSVNSEYTSVDYMWFKDVTTADGEHYRGVYFTSYRPTSTYLTSNSSNSYQDNNKYSTKTVYWFKYEPVLWRIIYANNGEALLLCQMIIDSREVYDDTEARTEGDTTIRANNYEYSNIRAWLNDNFYNVAFNDLERELILLTHVDNSLQTTGSNYNNFICADTDDYIFLLSYEEVNKWLFVYETAKRTATDYAKAQGVFVSTSSSTKGYSDWWLRSPSSTGAYTQKVLSGGYTSDLGEYVYKTINGIVPAMKIKVDGIEVKAPCQHNSVGDWEVAVPATCYTEGTMACKCLDCGEIANTYTLYYDSSNHPEDALELSSTIKATCEKVGWNEYLCQKCGGFVSKEIPITDHQFDAKGGCTICSYGVVGGGYGYDGDYNYDIDSIESGDIIYFGSYPQSEVTDFNTRQELLEYIPDRPTESDFKGWTSYREFYNGKIDHYIWYKDIEHNGYYYRAVYFTRYKPIWADGSMTADTPYQQTNGYSTECVYFFRYDPVSWIVLENNNGELFLLCNYAIDNMEYYDVYEETREIDGKTVYGTNYEYSSIRKWLNEDFYKTAFNDLEREMIMLSTVKNDKESANRGNDTYICPDTEDYVYLLSWEEMTSSKYGFSAGNGAQYMRSARATVYTQCVGSYSNGYVDGVSDTTYYYDMSKCWLRSPTDSYCVYITEFNGSLTTMNISFMGASVRPAIRIKLTNTHEHTEVPIGEAKEPTCTETGITAGVKCSECGKVIEPQEILSVKGHNIGTDGACSNCDFVSVNGGFGYNGSYTRVDENGNEDASGTYILFGSYPQSEVTGALAQDLTSIAGTLPTGMISSGWYSYQYYQDGVPSNIMWHIDICYAGEYYRGVYIEEQRNSYVNWALYPEGPQGLTTAQERNGYLKGNVYWFKFEPIKWRIISESNGQAMLLCEMIIDNQATQNSITRDGDLYYVVDENGNIVKDSEGNNVTANNYEYSSIRQWLNYDFYNTAFSDLEQKLIETTTVKNDAASNGDNPNNPNVYVSNDTNDRIFLLSYNEVYSVSFGFSGDDSRVKQGTAYYVCQGGYKMSSTSYAGTWLTRSTYNGGMSRIRYVNSSGSLSYIGVADYTEGIVPALVINLTSN